jgi:BlaI family penicillinase repressor
MPDEPQVADAEWQVMEVVWSKSPIEAIEVAEVLFDRTGWRPTTVKTLLHRLVKKGFLAFEQVGNRYRYRPLVSRDESLRQASESFVERFFGGEPLPMMMHFVKNAKLRPKDFEQLRRLLDEAEAGDARRRR